MTKESRIIVRTTMLTVSVWAVAILLVLTFLINCSRPPFVKLLVADEPLTAQMEQHKGYVTWEQVKSDSTGRLVATVPIDSLQRIALRDSILREDIKAGRLMTIEQMTERITGYYDKLIDVLIALFVIFTVISYFVIDNKFKKQYEDEKDEMKNQIKKDISDSISDSMSFQKSLAEKLRELVEDSVVKREEYEAVSHQTTENIEDIAFIYDYLENIEEQMARRESIDTTQIQEPALPEVTGEHNNSDNIKTT